MAICDAVAAVALIAAIGLVTLAWADLPHRVPVHFNGRGEADRWGGRQSLMVGPALSFASALLLALVSRFPRSFN